MKALIDAHTLLWAVDQPANLGAAAANVLQDPDNGLLLSAGTIWELAIKVGLRKLTLSLPFRDWMTRAIADLSLSILPITVDYANIQAELGWHHRDPFDRLLIAQAMAEDVPVVTADVMFDPYGVKRIWD